MWNVLYVLSSVDRYLDFYTFWLLGIIHVQVFMWKYIATSFRNIPRSGCGHMLNFRSSFWVTARLFSRGSLPSDLPTSTVWADSLPPHHGLSLSVIVILAVLLSWEQRLTVALTYISLWLMMLAVFPCAHWGYRFPS